MTKFYFLRHGKTVYNQEERLQGGQVDSPLLPEALHNATKAGAYLATVPFEAVVTSSQKRAVDTARAALSAIPRQYELITTPALREIDFGDWDGDKIRDHIADPAMIRFYKDPANYTGAEFGGESFTDVMQRGKDYLKEVFAAHPQGSILVVAHSVTISVVIGALLGDDFTTIKKRGLVDNTSVSVVATDDFEHFSLEEWNKTDFL